MTPTIGAAGTLHTLNCDVAETCDPHGGLATMNHDALPSSSEMSAVVAGVVTTFVDGPLFDETKTSYDVAPATALHGRCTGEATVELPAGAINVAGATVQFEPVVNVPHDEETVRQLGELASMRHSYVVFGSNPAYGKFVVLVEPIGVVDVQPFPATSR